MDERSVWFRTRAILVVPGVVVAAFIVLRVLWATRDVLISVGIAALIAMALNPAVDALQTRGLAAARSGRNRQVPSPSLGSVSVLNLARQDTMGLFGRRPRATRRSRRQREVRTGFAQDGQRLLGKVDAQGIPRLVDFDHAAVDENAEPPEDAARMRKSPELAYADEWNPAAQGDSVGTSTALNCAPRQETPSTPSRVISSSLTPYERT
jgi:hypothetical protein